MILPSLVNTHDCQDDQREFGEKITRSRDGEYRFRFLRPAFDPGNQYSVPYFWGTLGIVYNSKLVDKAPEHWDDFWRPEYKNSIMLIDGAREVMGLGLNSLGYGLNDKNADHLQEAVDKLYKLTPNIKAIVADEMKGYMIQNNRDDCNFLWRS